MTPFARRLVDRLWGSGEAAVTLPPMDGAMRPNRRLEDATLLAQMSAPDNLVRSGSDIVFSSGARLLGLDPSSGTVANLQDYPAAITSIAGHPDGYLAVGLANGGIVLRGGPGNGHTYPAPARDAPFGPTALAFDGDSGTLFACYGSARNGPEDWKRDLMGREASGSVYAFERAKGTTPRLVADGLAYPAGVVVVNGAIVVSEAWRHRLVMIDRAGKRTVVLDDLPGYPGRLAPGVDGAGFWLAVFAPRTQLVEFILREPRYRTRMMREVDPRYWMAPSLEPPRSFLEPLQGGAVKQLGILKPWAPSRSCGLLVRLDAAFQPVSSLHSRADGTRHGVTACLDCGDALLVTSRGGNAVLAVPLASERTAP